MVECQSCGGRYESIQADGTAYFHRCPPLSVVELQAAVDDGRVQLPKDETVEDAVQRRTYERANLRDENPPSTRERDAGAMKAQGDGVIEVASTTPVPVVTVPKK